MQASREYVIAQLTLVKENLADWLTELDGDYPSGTSVATMDDKIPEEQFRAELALMGQSLVNLATTN